MAVDDDAPALMALEAAHAADKRRLSRARRAADDEALAAFYFEVDGAQRLKVAEPFLDLFQPDDRHRGGRSLPHAALVVCGHPRVKPVMCPLNLGGIYAKQECPAGAERLRRSRPRCARTSAEHGAGAQVAAAPGARKRRTARRHHGRLPPDDFSRCQDQRIRRTRHRGGARARQGPRRETRIRTHRWKTLINGIQTDKYDVAMSGISMNVDRAKVAAFTVPYM